MTLADRLPRIPFSGEWRWKVKPHTNTHLLLKLQWKWGPFWLTCRQTTFDPYMKISPSAVEDKAATLLELEQRAIMRTSGLTLSYKDGNKNAR